MFASTSQTRSFKPDKPTAADALDLILRIIVIVPLLVLHTGWAPRKRVVRETPEIQRQRAATSGQDEFQSPFLDPPFLINGCNLNANRMRGAPTALGSSQCAIGARRSQSGRSAPFST